MPARTVIPGDAADVTLDSIRSDLRTLLQKHAGAVTRVRIERRNRGPGSGPLPEEVEVVRDADETTDELVASVLEQTMAVLAKDLKRPRGPNTARSGKIGPWSGRIVLLNHLAKKPELDELPIQVDDPEAVEPTTEGESIAIVGVVGTFLKGMCGSMVAIMNASAAREQAFAELLGDVGKTLQRGDAKAAKWEYRATKEREKTARVEEEARERAARSKHRWDAFDAIASEYHDVAEIWSRYYTQGRKPGDPLRKPPARPTADEVARVFDDARFEVEVQIGPDDRVSVRKLVAEMLAEPDAKQRVALAKRLASALSRLPPDTQAALKLKMLTTLGQERALEIAAWLSLPLT